MIIGGLCLVLALFLGYQLATPDQISSLSWTAAVLFFMLVPLLIRWHHPLTIICWNLPLAVFFLPGKQTVGIFIAGISLSLSLLSWVMRSRKTPLFIRSPATTVPLIFLTVVVFVTMAATGGLHARTFGSQQWGATRYLSVLGAIMAYFALIAQPTPPGRAKLLAALFFLPGTVWLFSVLFATGGLQSLLLLFPTYVLQESSFADTGADFERFIGLYFMSQAFCWFMLVRYGIRGIFNWHHPFRMFFFIAGFVVGLFGGFRSYIILFLLVFAIQFYYEKLFRGSLVWIFLACALLAGVFIVSYSDRLPLTFQRAISFVPGINIDPAARYDAQNSLQWRLDMWQVVLPLVPQYFFIGKGYGYDITDYILSSITARNEVAHGYYNAANNPLMIEGDYHQGILTLIIPLGIFGLLAFAAFCWGGVRVLYANYHYGDPELSQINTFLFAFFVAKLIFYVIFFGSFFQDLMTFVGLVGLSLTLNGGVRHKVPAAARQAIKPLAQTLQLQSV
ncbi:MAG: O-antigen ligase family protein [Verrucomicrobiota bacterium]